MFHLARLRGTQRNVHAQVDQVNYGAHLVLLRARQQIPDLVWSAAGSGQTC